MITLQLRTSCPGLQGDFQSPRGDHHRPPPPVSRRRPARAPAGRQDDAGAVAGRRRRERVPRSGGPRRPREAGRRGRVPARAPPPARGHRRGATRARIVPAAAGAHRRTDPGRRGCRTVPAARFGRPGSAAAVRRESGGTHRLSRAFSTRRPGDRRRSRFAVVGSRRIPTELSGRERRAERRVARAVHSDVSGAGRAAIGAAGAGRDVAAALDDARARSGEPAERGRAGALAGRRRQDRGPIRRPAGRPVPRAPPAALPRQRPQTPRQVAEDLRAGQRPRAYAAAARQRGRGAGSSRRRRPVAGTRLSMS